MAETEGKGFQGSVEYYEVLLKERESCVEEKRHINHNVDQLISTLSAGAIVLSITFTQLVFPYTRYIHLLISAWLLFTTAVSSILLSNKKSASNFECQIAVLHEKMVIEREGDNSKSRDIIDEMEGKKTRLSISTDCLDLIAIISFIIGSAFFLIFGALNILK